MSTFDPEDYGLQPVQETVPRNWRRELEARVREAEERAEKSEAREAERERSDAFAAAGIPNDGVYAMARQAYQGPLEPEAIRTAFGVSGQMAATQASLAGHQQAQAMAAGATPAQNPNAGARIASLRARSRGMRNGQGFNAMRNELGEIAAEEGIEPLPSGWKLPGRMAQ